MTDPCCGLSVIFCGFILHPIDCETINIPEIFSGVHGFKGKTKENLTSLHEALPNSTLSLHEHDISWSIKVVL